jgi:type IV pilus assembly protein PilE
LGHFGFARILILRSLLMLQVKIYTSYKSNRYKRVTYIYDHKALIFWSFVISFVKLNLMTKTYSSILQKRVKAFTLVEMLVVLVIIGILVLLALPNLINVTTRAKIVEAKTQLELVNTLEKNYFYEHSKYSKDLTELGFIQEKLSTESKDGRANYRIEITNATNTTFTARATAVVDFNGNGTFNVWEIDQDKTLKEVTPD